MMMIPRKRNEFDLFRDFFEGDDFFPIRRESAIMKTDIKEKKDKYIIEMDLPGYEKENINLSLKDGYLEVTAEVKKEDDNKEKEKFVHKERYYGHCSRSFYVGEQIKEEDVKEPPQMLSGIGNEYIEGVVREEHGYLIMLNTRKLFNASELQKIIDIQ